MELAEQLSGSTCSDVYLTTDGAVLKVPHEGSEEREAAWAVEAFALYGGVTPLRVDALTGALLMPRLGVDLASGGLSDEEQLRVCVDLTLRLRGSALDARAQDLSSWFSEPLCGGLKKEAWEEVKRLLSSSPEPVLLHGDLHHGNILLGPDGWQVIDPKGMVGDPAFEPSAYMRNPIGGLPSGDALLALTRRRLELFVELLPDDPARIWGWSFAQTVWCSEASQPGEFEDQCSLTALALWELRSEFQH